ncbi:MAG: hypothetical protein QW775_02720 [Ignisphaera sp.]|uniref:TFIIS-type domain-containing protein n=1 Tax=Ignisphaera aggregans TaxID=334771 RepID=A0A7C4NMB1_9CREN
MPKAIAQPVCPRCKNNLKFIVETETRSRESIVKYMYICDVCRYKHVTDSVTLRMNSDKLIIVRSSADQYS